jgi:hypothetical protein
MQITPWILTTEVKNVKRLQLKYQLQYYYLKQLPILQRQVMTLVSVYIIVKVKVKLSLCHEGIWGNGCIDPHFSWPRHLLEVSGQLHAPAALPTGERVCGIRWRGGWVGPRAGLDDMEKRKFLTLPGLELWPLSHPARSQLLYQLRYPGLGGGRFIHNCKFHKLFVTCLINTSPYSFFSKS